MGNNKEEEKQVEEEEEEQQQQQQQQQQQNNTKNNTKKKKPKNSNKKKKKLSPLKMLSFFSYSFIGHFRHFWTADFVLHNPQSFREFHKSKSFVNGILAFISLE